MQKLKINNNMKEWVGPLELRVINETSVTKFKPQRDHPE